MKSAGDGGTDHGSSRLGGRGECCEREAEGAGTRGAPRVTWKPARMRELAAVVTHRPTNVTGMENPAEGFGGGIGGRMEGTGDLDVLSPSKSIQ